MEYPLVDGKLTHVGAAIESENKYAEISKINHTGSHPAY